MANWMCERNDLLSNLLAVLTLYRPVGPDASIGANASYICKESQGAVLILNSPAHRESVFENDLLWKYMLRHHREWCEYARITLGQRVKSSDVVLLAGCVKTSADWKVVAFTRSSIGYHTGLEGHAFGAGAELRGSRTRELEPPKMHREGLLYPRAQSHSANSGKAGTSPNLTSDQLTDSSDPNASPDSSGSGEPLNDQSAFLNRYRTKRRGLFKKIVAGAGPHQLPEQEGGRSARNGEGLVAAQKEESVDEDDLASFENEVSHPLGDILVFANGCQGTAIDPLDTLLDYMLEVRPVRYRSQWHYGLIDLSQVSDAETAIASDDDLLGIVVRIFNRSFQLPIS